MAVRDVMRQAASPHVGNGEFLRAPLIPVRNTRRNPAATRSS